jgi:hypothetical protein
MSKSGCKQHERQSRKRDAKENQDEGSKTDQDVEKDTSRLEKARRRVGNAEVEVMFIEEV